MAFKFIAAVEALRDWKADANAKAVLGFGLALRCDKNGQCFPSLPTIARDAGLSESTARRALKRVLLDPTCPLEIKVTYRWNKSAIYTLKVRKAPCHDDTTPPVTMTPPVMMTLPPVTMTANPCHHDTTPCHSDRLSLPLKGSIKDPTEVGGSERARADALRAPASTLKPRKGRRILQGDPIDFPDSFIPARAER